MKLPIAVLIGTLTFITAHFEVHGQGTGFTYQGRLNEAGQPAAGIYDFRFVLHDSGSNGAAVGSPLTNNAVAVSNGLFLVTLDFGSGVFTGEDRWLEIAVRTNGSNEAFIPLSPRQPITGTPYAIRAANAATVPDNSITAAKLSAGAGTNGQVLKLIGGALDWAKDDDSGGTVTSVNAGTGLIGGPITTAGTLSINTSIVARLNVPNTFTTGPQLFETGANANKGLVVKGEFFQSANLQEWQNNIGMTLASVSANGLFVGSGAGLTSLNAGNLTSGTVADVRLSTNIARTGQVWLQNGNSDITAADFLGTTDNQPLELRVNNTRAWRVEPHDVSPNFVAGFSNNFVAQGTYGSVISGGGGQNSLTATPNLFTNSIADDYGFIGGGAGNQIYSGNVDYENDYGVIAGGLRNEMYASVQSAIGGGRGNAISNSISSVIGGGCVNWILEGSGNSLIGGGWINTLTNAFYGMIGAGLRNRVVGNNFGTIVSGSSNLVSSGDYSTIVGGSRHKVFSDYAFIGGGAGNTIDAFSHYSTLSGGGQHFIAQNATYATIPGGRNNGASASYTFAAGRRAKAMHAGTFVWADSTDTDFASTSTNQFLIRAGGGIGINTNDPSGAALNVNGTVTATAFAGPGSGLTGLDADNFSSGTLPNARLSNNVALLNASQTFTAAKNFSADVTFSSGAQIFADGGAALAPGLAFDSDTGIYSPTANTLALTTGGNERLRVTSSGNVGIGLNNPNARLEVALGGGQSLQFRQDDGLVPGINVVSTGGNAGIMRFRNAMEIWPSDDGTRAGKLDLRTTNGSPTIVMNGQTGIIIASELNVGISNQLSGARSSIGGGLNNTNQATNAVISGGSHNIIQGDVLNGTIAGGHDNIIKTNCEYATIGGGSNNDIESGADHATVGGGVGNKIRTGCAFGVIAGGANNALQSGGSYATIPGGAANTASGDYSFAAGLRANALHNGAFVWADATDANLSSTNNNSVTMRAAGGFRLFSNGGASAGVFLAAGGGSWTTVSDRHAKENFKPVNAQAVLDKVAALPLSTWNYKSQSEAIRHIGPMAQDFKTAFAVGETDTGITSVDADGVALAAIQGLNQKVEEKEARIRALETTVAELKQLIGKMAR